MTKKLNIRSLLQAKKSLSVEGFLSYLEYYDITVKDAELDDLGEFAEFIAGGGCPVEGFDQFYVGYKIPQIGKEFDLLRFGKNSIINIEIKRECDEAKALKQLIRNAYYLKFLGMPVVAFTFVTRSKTLYCLRDGDSLVVQGAECLAELLQKQEVMDIEDPDRLFDPSNYLVSPFNSTDKFLAGKYFLTHQQEEVRFRVVESLNSNAGAKFIAISGGAGTGKTLLTYDIARSFRKEKKKPLIIHCGQLNSGHLKLIERGWAISPVKEYKDYDLNNYDLLVVDEAQRIRRRQFVDLVERVRLAKCGCIFSLDKIQTLAQWEERDDIAKEIESIDSVVRFNLSEKIRTNKEIATFIKMLFNNKNNVSISDRGNIEINYFSSEVDAKRYLEKLDENRWEVLRFTPSQYNREHHTKYIDAWSKTAHQVIGQEFDGVAVAIDKFFAYADSGELVYEGGAYYAPVKMLFQNITRARKRLNLVIIGNEKILGRCMHILR